MRAENPTHIILLHLIILIILVEDYKLRNSSLGPCNFLQLPVTSSLLSNDTYFNTLYSDTLKRDQVNVGTRDQCFINQFCK